MELPELLARTGCALHVTAVPVVKDGKMEAFSDREKHLIPAKFCIH